MDLGSTSELWVFPSFNGHHCNVKWRELLNHRYRYHRRIPLLHRHMPFSHLVIYGLIVAAVVAQVHWICHLLLVLISCVVMTKEDSSVGHFLQVCCLKSIRLDLDHRVVVVGLGVNVCRHLRHPRLRHRKVLSIIKHGHLRNRSITQRQDLSYNKCKFNRNFGMIFRHYLSLVLRRQMGIIIIISNIFAINNPQIWAACIIIILMSLRKHVVGVMLLGSWVLELMFVFFSKKWGIVKFCMMIKSFFWWFICLGGLIFCSSIFLLSWQCRQQSWIIVKKRNLCVWFVVDLDEFDGFIWEQWPDKVMNFIFILIGK